ncbi:hypothetical protein [Hymenobacter koreensis]|uniref:DUF4304 domain-containing protein n=1 Tax=Hymenobacter koreensis TaxID=1084523 RepID=A0ABP8J7W3_9BACT
MLQSVHLISDSVFAKWTLAWAEQQENTKPLPFFKRDSAFQQGVVLGHASANLLFSTMGASTVKIRFGLRQDDQGAHHFELLLFGVDNYGQRLTPYFNPQAGEFSNAALTSGEQGNLPAELAAQWKKHWQEKVLADEVTAAMFETPYGFLQGYNYPLREFMEAVKPFASSPDVAISFGLHKYFGLPKEAHDTEGRLVYTFGLLFNAVAVGAADPTDDVYFDLTAPCPRTC